MTVEIKTQSGVSAAALSSIEPLIYDVQSALDLAMSVRYSTGCTRLALPKECICEDFFRLSTCLAGEILQKYINYNIKLAVYGDFSTYTSKPLHDFIYESNCGKDVFFVLNKAEALSRLLTATE